MPVPNLTQLFPLQRLQAGLIKDHADILAELSREAIAPPLSSWDTVGPEVLPGCPMMFCEQVAARPLHCYKMSALPTCHHSHPASSPPALHRIKFDIPPYPLWPPPCCLLPSFTPAVLDLHAGLPQPVQRHAAGRHVHHAPAVHVLQVGSTEGAVLWAAYGRVACACAGRDVCCETGDVRTPCTAHVTTQAGRTGLVPHPCAGHMG